MIKKILFLALLFAAVIVSPAQAISPNAEVPEKNGDFPDPDHPGVRVRVFVHNEKPERSTSNVLVCPTDPDSNAVVGATGWKLPANWSYNLNVSSVPASVGSANLPGMASRGFNSWTSATGNLVHMTQGANTSVDRSRYDNLNVIAWGRTSGSALGVTYTRYYTSTGLVVDVDTIMNKKFAWGLANNMCIDSNIYDSEEILTHELGHWFGLDDEYDAAQYGNATMYGYGARGETKKTTLEQSDILGAAAIYE